METNPNSNNGSEPAATSANTVNRAAQGAHAIVDRVAEKAGPTFERVHSGINSANETLQSGIEQFGEKGDRMLEDCRGCVRDHPLLSIGLAVAAGMLLGRLRTR